MFRAVDLWIQRIAGIEIKKAGRNFEPAERQRRVHIVESHVSFQAGCNPLPVKCKSMMARPLARLPRIRNGSFVLIATSNFQSRNGACGIENCGRDDGGCGAGRPGNPIGMKSRFLRNRLFVIAIVPVTFALLNGPTTLMSASARTVSVSLRATSALSAFNCKIQSRRSSTSETSRRPSARNVRRKVRRDIVRRSARRWQNSAAP